MNRSSSPLLRWLLALTLILGSCAGYCGDWLQYQIQQYQISEHAAHLHHAAPASHHPAPDESMACCDLEVDYSLPAAVPPLQMPLLAMIWLLAVVASWHLRLISLPLLDPFRSAFVPDTPVRLGVRSNR